MPISRHPVELLPARRLLLKGFALAAALSTANCSESSGPGTDELAVAPSGTASEIGEAADKVPSSALLAGRVAVCIVEDSTCIAGLLLQWESGQGIPAKTEQEAPGPLTELAARYASQVVDGLPDRSIWDDLLRALARYQESAAEDVRNVAATALSVMPVGDFAPGCATWDGSYHDAGRFATAGGEYPPFGLSLEVSCSHGSCGSIQHPYSVNLDISPPPEDLIGTNPGLRYEDLSAIASDRAMVVYTPVPLYDQTAMEAGPGHWCVNTEPPCYSPSAGKGEALFGLLLNCEAGTGVLLWGALADEVIEQ